MWTYVKKRENKQWLWLAVCRGTKQIVEYFIGARDSNAAKQFKAQIASNYQNLPTHSDMWKPYKETFDPKLHQSNEGRGQTNHIERCNATIRARIGRLVRKTLSFSKCEKMHKIVIHLFILKYNLEKASLYSKT